MIPDIPTKERQVIYELTEKLNAHLHQFFTNYPGFDPVRFPATALTSAFENPELPLEVLEQIVKVPVWIFTIDAVIDEGIMPESVITHQLSKYEQIVLGRNVNLESDDQLGQVLLHLRKTLERKPLFHELRPLWEETYIKMIRGMLFEARDWTTRPDVSIDEYLEHGLYSIGVPTYVVSTWILQSSEAQTSLEHRTALEKMMRLSGICIRLANDLRTYEKEKRENNLNAIFIKEREYFAQGLDAATAQQLGYQEVENMLKCYMDQFWASSNDRIPLMKALRRLTDFSTTFYSKYDFHTVSLVEISINKS